MFSWRTRNSQAVSADVDAQICSSPTPVLTPSISTPSGRGSNSCATGSAVRNAVPCSFTTILTEYLEACGADVSQRLATALLYGIKSDTLMLNRETGPADLRAFMSLYPLTNYNTLRRIERPELPLNFAEFLARVLPRMRKQMGCLTW